MQLEMTMCYFRTILNWIRAMAQAVSCWPLAIEARVRAQVTSCGICGGRRATGTGYSQSSSVRLLLVISLLHTHLSPPH
jgi:hypothetical protein